MEILNLLQTKNRYLHRFHEVTLDFQKQADVGQFEALEVFQNERDLILKILNLYDRKITEAVGSLPQMERTTNLSDEVERLLNEKNELVHRIILADEKIMTKISEEKAKLTKEISSTEKSKTLVKKFKSSWVAGSGEELDKKL